LAAQRNCGIPGTGDDKFADGYAGISVANGTQAVTPAPCTGVISAMHLNVLSSTLTARSVF
jgi:hypothetical protein